MANELTTTVLGGLTITVEYTIQPAEYDVGITSSYCDGWEIVAINGRKCKKAPMWLHKRIDEMKGEAERIDRLCEEHAADQSDGQYD